MILSGAPHNPGIRYIVNVDTSNAINNRPTESFSITLSCGKRIFPSKYNAHVPNTAIQIAKNTSLSSQCFCNTKSALDKNLNAKANSRNPNDTFTVFIQPPERGKVLSQPGNIANSIKGKANASEKPNIPISGAKPPFDAASTKIVPTIGPVHENDTTARANAIKKIPTIPP